MSVSSRFAEFLCEELAPLGQIRIKRMFGGGGVYCGDVMFGLIADDTLFLKTDDGNRADFEIEGLGPFVYASKGGRSTVMSYWRAPERLLDDSDELQVWAGKALAAALRSGTKAKRRRQS